MLSGVSESPQLVHFMFRDLHGATQIHQPVAVSFCFSTYSPWKLISLPPDGQKWKKSRSNFWGTLNSLRKITIVLERSLSKASWQQRAGESLKRTLFTLKQWFLGGWGAEDNLKGGHIATTCRKTDLLEKTLTSPTFRQQNVYSQILSRGALSVGVAEGKLAEFCCASMQSAPTF